MVVSLIPKTFLCQLNMLMLVFPQMISLGKFRNKMISVTQIDLIDFGSQHAK